MGMQNRFWGRGINVRLRGAGEVTLTGLYISCHAILHGCGWSELDDHEQAPGIPAPQSGITGQLNQALGNPRPWTVGKLEPKEPF